MNLTIQQVADIAEYAAMYGIPYNAAVGVFTLTGSAGMRRIITRGVVK